MHIEFHLARATAPCYHHQQMKRIAVAHIRLVEQDLEALPRRWHIRMSMQMHDMIKFADCVTYVYRVWMCGCAQMSVCAHAPLPCKHGFDDWS